MGKRIDYSYVKDYVEKTGNKLLSTEFLNAKSKLMFQCCDGHIFEMVWNNFQQGERCPECMLKINSQNRTKANQEFLDNVFNLVGNEYKFLEDYKKNNIKIKVRHELCSFEYFVTPSNFLIGKRCPRCSGRGNFRNTEFLQNEICTITNGEYELIGEYTKTIEKTTIIHKTCGCIFESSPNSFINNGTRCPECFGTPKKNTEIFIKEVFELVNDEYEVIDNYVDSKHKIKFLHKSCGREFDMLPNAFLRGQRCPRCRGFYKTTEEFKKELFLLFGDEYSLCDEYQSAKKKIRLKHNKCGKFFETKPSHILNKHGCPHCFKYELKSHKQFCQEVYDLVGEEYSVYENYKGANKKILFKHEKCGNIYFSTPSNFYRGCRCPICTKSKGEDKINRWLQENNIYYIRQYRFKDCKYKNPLPFDFAILDFNSKIILLIEYDGEQHFKPVKFHSMLDSKSHTNFQKQLEKDKIKNNFCLINNINLLRINYNDYCNIEEILNKELLDICPGRQSNIV